MAAPYTAPSLKEEAFNCPSCGAYARQRFGEAQAAILDGKKPATPAGVFALPQTWRVDGCLFTRCERCERTTIWVDGRMIHPDTGSGPPPNPDLPADIHDDYLEALGIADRSPRGAAALLRLCIQKLCKQLGEPGDNINADIASLVKKGLSARVQRALDVVRVVGNNAVHPGRIDLKDDRETVASLFNLMNLIAQTMISEPKAEQEMYDKLPQSALDGIAKRDRAKP